MLFMCPECGKIRDHTGKLVGELYKDYDCDGTYKWAVRWISAA